MTLSLTALSALVALAAPTPLGSDGEAYLELGVGVTSTADMESLIGSNGIGSGFSVNVLLGYEWEEMVGDLDFALEAEGIFTRQSMDDQLLGPTSSDAEYLAIGAFMFSGTLTWQVNDEVAFYGGGGVGIAPSLTLADEGNAASNFGIDEQEALMAQGKAGIRIRLSEQTDWYLQYRRLISEEMTIRDSFLDQSFDYELEQDIVEIGIRYGL